MDSTFSISSACHLCSLAGLLWQRAGHGQVLLREPMHYRLEDWYWSLGMFDFEAAAGGNIGSEPDVRVT